MPHAFQACIEKVARHGPPPQSFLDELVDWAKAAEDDIFAVNARDDIYSSTVNELGPWDSALRRKAAMLEVLRVLGGFESTWRWGLGKDPKAPAPVTPCNEEAGIFQCSGDSMGKDPSLKALLRAAAGSTDCDTFRSVTKANHRFALEYCARLLRFTTDHHGPIKNRHIHPHLRRDAMLEFEKIIDG